MRGRLTSRAGPQHKADEKEGVHEPRDVSHEGQHEESDKRMAQIAEIAQPRERHPDTEQHPRKREGECQYIATRDLALALAPVFLAPLDWLRAGNSCLCHA